MKVTEIFVLGAIIVFVWFVASAAYQIVTGKRGKGGEFGEPAREGCVGYDKDGNLVVKNCDEVFKND